MADPDMQKQEDSAPPQSAGKPLSWIKWLLLGIAVVGLAILLSLGLGRSFLEYLKKHWDEIRRWESDSTWLFGAGFFAVYVCAVGLSIPIAVPLSLAAGALYGRWFGTLFVSFASAAGATVAFLASRYLFRDAVQRRFGDRLQTLNRGVETDGAYYLLFLRLQPVVPFWLINLGMGLTPMRVVTYWLVSQIGMLPGTFVYVNVGASAEEITEAKDVWPLLLALGLLGLVPLVIRFLVRWSRRQRDARGGRV